MQGAELRAQSSSTLNPTSTASPHPNPNFNPCPLNLTLTLALALTRSEPDPADLPDSALAVLPGDVGGQVRGEMFALHMHCMCTGGINSSKIMSRISP